MAAVATVLLICLLPLLSGCPTYGSCAGCARTPEDDAQDKARAARIPPDRQQFYDATAAVFDRAVFYKPEEASLEAAPYGLEPLIMQEIHPDLPPSGADPIMSDDPSGEGSADSPVPVLYVAASEVTLMGQTCPQVSYWWRHRSPLGHEPSWRGIRLTLGRTGFPVISEVLQPPGTLRTASRVVFVSSAIETGAGTAYGEPLPGRRYAVEGPVSARGPDTVVARVLSDGPRPMGPYVYLDRHLQVATLLCRCMPSQVEDVPETRSYRILPLESLPADVVESLTARQPDPGSLERILRLPAGF